MEQYIKLPWVKWGINGVLVLLCAWLGLIMMFGWFDIVGFFTKGYTMIPVIFPLPFLTYFTNIQIPEGNSKFITNIPGLVIILPIIVYFVLGVIIGYFRKKMLDRKNTVSTY